MQVFGHWDRDAEVERIARLPVAVDNEVAGDRALGNLDGGAGGAAEEDGRGDIADGGVGDLGVLRCEVGSVEVDLAAGQRCRG